jgi:hypothetical protein
MFKNILEEKEKTLKFYFNTDIFIQGFPGNEAEKNEEVINEEIFQFKSNGELIVPAEDVDNLQTIDDIIDYLSDVKVGGKQVINKLVEEVILTMAGVGEKELEKVVSEGDKILVDIDYGVEKYDSIGFKVNKVAGSSSISLVMKKDNKIIPGQFDVNEFNKQLVFYRNSVLGG